MYIYVQKYTQIYTKIFQKYNATTENTKMLKHTKSTNKKENINTQNTKIPK